ncbi:MAG: low molecular weight protein arginine phosphatase [Bacillota bacterium]|nr:low molecular weight protein arginine phosphatase [Bacillota bacterium]MDP4171521.1 low molecular weight protein arginine phosphatase [Bacillota bacterium]
MQRILFVCTGNTCRSPMAEAILKNKNLGEIEVKSAGVFAVDGGTASMNAEQVWQENNIQHTHRSSMLSEELVNWATHIFTMTDAHKESVINSFPHSADKTYRLKEFAGESGNLDVSDPFGGNVEVYRITFRELERFIDAAVTRLNKEKK